MFGEQSNNTGAGEQFAPAPDNSGDEGFDVGIVDNEGGGFVGAYDNIVAEAQQKKAEQVAAEDDGLKYGLIEPKAPDAGEDKGTSQIANVTPPDSGADGATKQGDSPSQVERPAEIPEEQWAQLNEEQRDVYAKLPYIDAVGMSGDGRMYNVRVKLFEQLPADFKPANASEAMRLQGEFVQQSIRSQEIVKTSKEASEKAEQERIAGQQRATMNAELEGDISRAIKDGIFGNIKDTSATPTPKMANLVKALHHIQTEENRGYAEKGYSKRVTFYDVAERHKERIGQIIRGELDNNKSEQPTPPPAQTRDFPEAKEATDLLKASTNSNRQANASGAGQQSIKWNPNSTINDEINDFIEGRITF